MCWSDFWASADTFDQNWQGFDLSWPGSGHIWPTSAKYGPIRAKFGKSLANVGRMCRPAPRNLSKNASILFRAVVQVLSSTPPPGSTLASTLRAFVREARSAAREHLFNILEHVSENGVGQYWSGDSPKLRAGAGWRLPTGPDLRSRASGVEV